MAERTHCVSTAKNIETAILKIQKPKERGINASNFRKKFILAMHKTEIEHNGPTIIEDHIRMFKKSFKSESI